MVRLDIWERGTLPPLVDAAALERFLERVPEAERAFYVQLARRTFEPDPVGFAPRELVLDDPELEAEWRAVFRDQPSGDVDPFIQIAGSGAHQDLFDVRFAAELDTLRRMGSAGAMVGSTFVHRVLGIAFTCPPGWTLHDLRELQESAMKRRINTRDDFVNRMINAATTSALPLVAVAAPILDDPVARLGSDEIAPVISINIDEPVASTAGSGFDLMKKARNDLILFGAHMEDYRVLHSPERTTLGGCDAVTCCAAYTTLHADAPVGCPVRDHTYYVQRGAALYCIHMVDYPDRDPRLAFDFTSIVESTRFSSKRGVFAMPT